jgi:aspartyl-tRNA(Asn)/glutamyl-tRNA(Gln) amidotransferase subunit A
VRNRIGPKLVLNPTGDFWSGGIDGMVDQGKLTRMMRKSYRGLRDLAADIRSGRSSATEIVEEALERIEKDNKKLVAFVHLDPDGALEAAALVDRVVADGGDPGPLAGIPFGVKDLQDCVGMPTLRGSLTQSGAAPATVDAPIVARMRGAGGIPIGKTAVPEFGFDSATKSRLHGVTRNPWDLSRSPGGSSGGASSAVAAGLVPVATGSDGGGSIRSPAAWCGLVGHKPSHGMIPDAGTSDFSVAGVLTHTVADTALVLDIVAGPDPRDRMSLPARSWDLANAIEVLDVGGLRVAWSADMGYAPVDAEVAALARGAADALIEAAGLSEVEVPFRSPNAVMSLVRLSAFMLKGDLELKGIYPDRADELAPFTREGLDYAAQGPRGLVAALRDRREVELAAAELFSQVDVLMTPSTACSPIAADADPPSEIKGMDASETGAEPFTILANMTWQPAVSVPAGLTSEGLPVGLQIITKRWRDDIALRLGQILEEVRPWRVDPVPLVDK